ncbi:MAG: cellulase family glycosylhydrolase [Proteobacteria bacterium]|nr:cellulase family glycosylhydrolase [Pseudomonadota bacterium]
MPHPLISLASTLAGMARGAIPRRWTSPVPSSARWTIERARRWRGEQGWLNGCNFIPSTAGNQLEMWQAETWDPETIDREIGWAADLGMNSLRVFLHDLLWAAEGTAFLDRVDEFLAIADRHGVSTMLVLFDGVWHPEPALGPQGEPKARLHNALWVQGPGRAILCEPSRWPELRPYVDAVVGRFKSDHRVVAWDLFNEPDQTNAISYPRLEVAGKTRFADGLLNHVFDWCQAIDPAQPLTAGVYLGVNGAVERVSRLTRTMLGRSDVISFHSYGSRKKLLGTITYLARYQRPLLCTEWMARSIGSPVSLIRDLADHDVDAWCWGLVEGRSQTRYSWTSWLRRTRDDSALWFHDLLHADGRAYDEAKVALLRTVATSKKLEDRAGTSSFL